MTPKEKAEELVGRFETQGVLIPWTAYLQQKEVVKQCALIAVDEILSAPFENSYMEIIPEDQENTDWFWDHFRKYWNDVKNEIELL